MPWTEVAIAFFVVAAIVLFWLGRQQRREMLGRESDIEIGMSETDVLTRLGPPDEIRLDLDPLDPGFFADHRRESYIYGQRLRVSFERGEVRRVLDLTKTTESHLSPEHRTFVAPPPELVEAERIDDSDAESAEIEGPPSVTSKETRERPVTPVE